MDKWYEKETEVYQGVVISNRIRLARNIDKYFFPGRMSSKAAYELIQDIKDAMYSNNGVEVPYHMIRMDSILALERISLMERHMISPAFLEGEMPRAIIMSEDESICVMINEEDHLRIQSMNYGTDIQTTFEKANQIDEMLEKHLDFAFSEHFGYKTACPTNAGTGMRASYMLHLPALETTGQLQILLEAIGKFGVTFRGLYGENSEASGSVFQLSNQVTLGFSEQEIIENLNSITMQIVEQELNIRQKLLREKKLQFEDAIYRSYGILKYARSLTSKEAMNYLSDIKLGLELGIIKSTPHQVLNIFNLMTNIQPAHLQQMEKKNLTSEERDASRASYIREHLPEVIGG